MNRQPQTLLLLAAFTAILAGYLSVWLPNEAVGLSFIGVEIGEWVKFLPQMQSGEIAVPREFLYLPPISLAFMMMLFSATWREAGRRAWTMRGLAFLVALLAFPSIDAIWFEPASEWLARLILVAAVGVLALAGNLLQRMPERLLWLMMALVGMAGALLPITALLAVRPAVELLLQVQVSIGIGAWLTAAGHLLVFVVAITRASNRKSPVAATAETTLEA